METIIAGNMQDTDNDDFIGAMQVINCIALVEDHTQIS
jgi:hypothetical protein